jgi:catechol 2,3-dioxygenase-like lactoylglutathione lyase family enzyme
MNAHGAAVGLNQIPTAGPWALPINSLELRHLLHDHRNPMLESIDHINIVVADLEAMLRFYTQVLGLKLSKRVTISGPWIDKVVGLKNVSGEVVYLDLPSGPRIELIRYLAPIGAAPANLDRSNTHGIRHLAFRVDNIDEIFARLSDAGVKFLSDVQQVPDSQVTYAGGVRKRLVYFHDPEGNLLELCEYRDDRRL